MLFSLLTFVSLFLSTAFASEDEDDVVVAQMSMEANAEIVFVKCGENRIDPSSQVRLGMEEISGPFLTPARRAEIVVEANVRLMEAEARVNAKAAASERACMERKADGYAKNRLADATSEAIKAGEPVSVHAANNGEFAAKVGVEAQSGYIRGGYYGRGGIVNETGRRLEDANAILRSDRFRGGGASASAPAGQGTKPAMSDEEREAYRLAAEQVRIAKQKAMLETEGS